MLFMSQLFSGKDNGTVGLIFIDTFLKPHTVVTAHERTVSGTKDCLAVSLGDFQFTGMDIDQGMLTVAVGTVTVICEVARYKYIRAIENIQFFHIQV